MASIASSPGSWYEAICMASRAGLLLASSDSEIAMLKLKFAIDYS